ncbi:hypothetical protein [Sphaerotilus montanus]|uniref:hypothetical protein n=1 Tax=Sphaerotilus montanus TaxID=522889 RepID=UPI003FA2CA13
MLGLLVTEFVNMVEARFGAPVAEAILFDTDVPSGHDDDLLDAYPAAQLQVLFDALSRRVGETPHALLQGLASRIVGRIRLVHPDVFSRHADLFGQIAASGDDVVLSAYEIDESETEEIELLLGEREQAERLVRGLLVDLPRYERRGGPARRSPAAAALMHVRTLMR